MVLGRVWNFVKRHKKKVIFTGILGGGYLAWQYLWPRLQERMLRKLLEEFAKAGADGIAPSVEETERQRRRAKFKHKQDVSDSWARERLAQFALMARHHAGFPIEGLQVKIKEASSKGDKQAALDMFMEMQVECLARLVSATYALHLMMLLHRIEFNIVGRDQDAVVMGTYSPEAHAAAQKVDDAYENFLEFARCFDERGLEHLAGVARRAVASRAETAGLLPKSSLTASDLEKFLLDVCTSIDEAFFTASTDTGAACVATLLPESLDKDASQCNAKVVMLLNEARDVLESPHFRQAAKVLVTESVKRLVGILTVDSGDAAAAPLSDGKSCTLAKLFGPLMELSNKVLTGEGENEFVLQFQQEPVVEEMCEAVYFQDETADAA